MGHASRGQKPGPRGTPAAGNKAYTGPRPDLAELIPRDRHAVLDLGCATGELGAYLRATRPGTYVAGVELDPAMHAIAAKRLDSAILADLEDADGVVAQLDRTFDCLVCGDVLEHLSDPWSTLRAFTRVLSNDALLVVSIPNIGHFTTWWNVVVRRRWPYRARGIHDSTHLRFFARRNLAPLLEQAGFRVERVISRPRIIERPHAWNRFAHWFAIPGLRDLLTFQFLIVGRRVSPASGPSANQQAAELLPPSDAGSMPTGNAAPPDDPPSPVDRPGK